MFIIIYNQKLTLNIVFGFKFYEEGLLREDFLS